MELLSLCVVTYFQLGESIGWFSVLLLPISIPCRGYVHWDIIGGCTDGVLSLLLKVQNASISSKTTFSIAPEKDSRVQPIMYHRQAQGGM